MWGPKAVHKRSNLRFCRIDLMGTPRISSRAWLSIGCPCGGIQTGGRDPDDRPPGQCPLIAQGGVSSIHLGRDTRDIDGRCDGKKNGLSQWPSIENLRQNVSRLFSDKWFVSGVSWKMMCRGLKQQRKETSMPRPEKAPRAPGHPSRGDIPSWMSECTKGPSPQAFRAFYAESAVLSDRSGTEPS
jgi:hypothetical protein